MKLLRLYFILAALILWLSRYMIIWPMALLAGIMAFLESYNVKGGGVSDYVGLIVTFVLFTVFIPLVHYLIFRFHVAIANTISRYLDQKPVLSHKIGLKFIESFKLYANIYTGELKVDRFTGSMGIEKELLVKKPWIIKDPVHTKGGDFNRYPGGDRYHKILLLVEGLPPCPIKEKSEEVLSTLEMIYENFKQDEGDIERSIHVIPSMLDSMMAIIKQYASVESLTSGSGNKEKIETQILGILTKLKNALEHHLGNLLENDMIALDAEIGLLSSLIRSEGLDMQQSSSEMEPSG